MKILFVTNLRYPPQGLGGARLSTHQLCEMLQERGHEVAVLAQIREGGWLWIWNRIRAQLGDRAFPIDRAAGYPVYRGWEPLKGIGEVVERFRPDVALAGTSAVLSIAAGLVERRIPTVAYFRSLEFHKFGEAPEDLSLLTAFAVSTYTARRVRDVLDIECHVVPSIVRPEYYLVDWKPARVLHVNPDPSKGIHTTLELARSRPDIDFDVVRCWPETSDVAAVRDVINGMDNVEWHEPIKDMRSLYRTCRVLLVPSLLEEAWGRVVLEAQLNGIPIIASNRGGLPESVGPGGFAFEPEEGLDAWANALDTLWEDPDQYDVLSRAAWQHARRRDVQPEAIVDRVETLLGEHVRANHSSTTTSF